MLPHSHLREKGCFLFQSPQEQKVQNTEGALDRRVSESRWLVPVLWLPPRTGSAPSPPVAIRQSPARPPDSIDRPFAPPLAGTSPLQRHMDCCQRPDIAFASPRHRRFWLFH